METRTKGEGINIIHPYMYAGMMVNINVDSYPINNELMFKIICNRLDVDFNIIMESPKWRKREVVTAKQIYFYLKKKRTRESLASIGSYLKKDHATVLHGIKQVNNHIETEKGFKKLVDSLTREIAIEETRINNIDTVEIMKKYA
jgi:hypothetical protein